MLTVAVISQKGGAGKTTIAVGLAVAHQLAGGLAVVVDLELLSDHTTELRCR